MDLRGKKIVVVGAGSSGLAVCRFAVAAGARVWLSDRRSPAQLPQLSELDAAVELDLGGHNSALFAAADMVVVSPGVPTDIEPLAVARSAGAMIIGEIELASRYLRCPMIAITGTNGKSTTTTVLGEMLRACGQRTFIGGNLGQPLISAVDADNDWAVVELSSFQLETVVTLRPRYALLLNISLDHLDRYPDMAAYTAAKQAIFSCQNSNDVAVLNGDDAEVLRLAAGCRAQQVLFSTTRLLPRGMSYHGGMLHWRGYGNDAEFDPCQLRISGIHNIENVMAALIPPLLEGYDSATLWRAACVYRGLPHRMELVRTLNGVRWYNDSKGTNPGSVIKSVASLAAPITLIAGGKDKGGDYRQLRAHLAGKVTCFILLGQAAAAMEQAWADLAPVVRVDNMTQAVAQAARHTSAPGSVLLSPGCSSFDMFASFEQRGQAFTAAVQALPEAEG